jgi:hypothetical protein
MQRKLLLASALLLGGMVVSTQFAGAASVPSQTLLLQAEQTESGLVHQAQEKGRRPLGKVGGYYSRCYYWRRECARRWGWGSRRYRSCVALHFCTLRPAR